MVNTGYVYLLFLILLTLPAAGHAPSATIEEEPARPSFLWLTIEDTSEYQFSCYGNQNIETPTIDMLARKGIQYTHASSTAPHCSPARSTLITGCYATTFGMDIHREDYDTPDDIFYPQYLREAGYFCTNNAKTDYNTTIDDKSLWDECGREASYSSSARKPGQPFFSVFNTEATHMGRIRSITLEGRRDFKALGIDPETLQMPGHVPDLPAMRSDEAYQLEASRDADGWVRAFVDDLKIRGLDENTIIFFFSDHGGCLPRGKGFPFESGLDIPLVIYVPPIWQEKLGIETGIISRQLVGFVDFAPTILSLAGMEPPEFMQGKAFLGSYGREPRGIQFGFRSNQENYHYDPCRTASDGNFKYIRNYIPHKPFCLRNLYQWGMPANLAWDQYIFSGECTSEEWLQPYRPKEAEMLFDLSNDPWELHNLADDPRFGEILKTMRMQVSQHIRETGDLGFFVRGRRKKPGGLYNWVRETEFPVNELIAAAEMAGMPAAGDVDRLTSLIGHPVPEMRFWGAIGFNTLGSQGILNDCPAVVLAAINDSEPQVAAAAAEAACYLGQSEKGIDRLLELLEVNFSPAYSSLETLTWYPGQKEILKEYIPEIRKLLNENSSDAQDRMGLDIKIRSLLVNLGDLPLSQLYTQEEKEKGIQVNQNPRKFRYPSIRTNLDK